MANTIINMEKVSEDILIDFMNELTITGTAWKDYEKDMTGQSWDTGGSVTVPLPVNFLVGDGAVITGTADTVENSEVLTITYRKHIEAQFTSKELTLDADVKFRERFITPMAKNMANIVDQTVGQDIRFAAYHHIGTAGSLPNSYKSGAAAGAALNNLGVRMDNRWLGFDEASYLEMVSAGTLQNSNDISLTRDINRKYLLNRIANMQTYHSTNIPAHIAGIGDSSVAPASGVVAAGNVKTTVTTGNTIVVENLQASDTGVFLKGDKITIEGVYKVNPITLGNIDEHIQYTVLANADSSAGGEATITVSPSIISDITSPYRNISNDNGIPGGVASKIKLASANTGTGSTVKKFFPINIAYVPEAILFAAPPLKLPSAGVGKGDAGRAVDPQTGISMRVVADYDVINDKTIWRTDVQFAVKINADRMVAILG